MSKRLSSLIRSTMLRFLILTIFAGVGGQSAHSGEFKFEPTSCKVDSHGKLYVALGHTVLAVPPNQTSNVRLLVPNLQVHLAPSNPAEPEGCPENPWQISSYEFLHSFQNTLNALPQKDLGQIQPDFVKLIMLPPDRNSDGVWPGEKLNLELMEYSCGGNAIREELSNGIHGCRKTRSKNEAVAGQWYAYVTPRQIYATPFGRPFGSACIGSGKFYQCSVAYMYKLDLGVAYTLRPAYGGSQIPMDHMIELDRAIRAEISSMIVEGYAWPAEKRGSEPKAGSSR